MKTMKNEINVSLKRELDQLKAVPERMPEKIQAGRMKFMAEARLAADSVSLRSEKRHKGWFKKFTIRKERFAMVKILTIILIALGTALASTGVVAAASQNSLPDQALYDVKVWTEDLRLGIAASIPEDSLDLALEFANRRITEITDLTNMGKASPDFVRQRLEIQIYQAYQAVTQLQGDALDQALIRLESMLQTQEETMTRLRTNSVTEPECARTRDMLQQHLRLFQGQPGNPTEMQSRLRLRLQLHKSETSGNPLQNGQNGSPIQGTPQPGAGGGYCLTGTPEGGYGSGNMYALTGTPSGGYGNGNMYALTGTPDPANCGIEQYCLTQAPLSGYGGGNGYQYCLTATPVPGSGGGQGGQP